MEQTISFAIHHPFCMLSLGPTGSGKTFAVAELLMRRAEVMEPVPDKIIYVYSVFQPIYYKLQQRIADITFTQNLGDIETLATRDSLVVIDDCMTEIERGKYNKLVTDYFTKYCHHLGESRASF